MVFKRKFSSKRMGRGSIRKPFIKRGTRRVGSAIRNLAKKVRRITSTIETKSGVEQITDNINLRHNNQVTVSSAVLETQTGTLDNENSRGMRIGDKITLSNVQFTMMFELNEAYTDVTLRLMVVRAAKNDIPNITDMFHGASGNKMLDTFNNERYSMLYQKYVRLRSNPTAAVPSGTQFPGSGTYQGPNQIMSRATKIVKFSVPGRKFSRSGIIQYQNNDVQPKFFDYYFIVYAYSNFATVDSGPVVYNVAHINDCIIRMHYKDA
ncbi:putative capsid protein [McMurdo Ice Shelf pond-associated circular DNA virus-7]|uniref:putative capsid protein n=1 Tax=McMurdo Ice Shelf pond-associated circular DNA virus-7 TaxID=1521391 RepID=UPI0004D16DD9|nr:putative capsid protein [McMurdo Ice Shelf pond-associated circular DNA virus-7]AIF71518.1 putative capsid protein [McMurdo Ice Shelf pond-associated circular DNA virus-7]